MRKVKGMSIAKEHTIKQVEGGQIVPSQNSNKRYFVAEHGFECTCPDCRTRKLTCKHAYAVKYFLGIEKADGTTEKVRLTYKQAWHAYNQAQTSEIKNFELNSYIVSKTIRDQITDKEIRDRPNENNVYFIDEINSLFNIIFNR